MPNIEVLGAQQAANLVVAAPAAVAHIIELVSPLEVSFSQNVIYPKFADGKNLDDSVRLICERAAASDPAGDLTLDPPFPRIEAMRWTPKLRDGTGKPLLDENGQERRGKEGLFSVDNRLLYALQRAAVAQHPRRCLVAVAVLTDRVEIAKHLKKFRTRTNGLSITVSEWNGVGRDNMRNHSAMRIWDWRSAVGRAEDGGAKALAEAADTGSCGCWEYLDNTHIRRGPFSNWQMRQWWERKMLPPTLRIRPYDAAATLADRSGEGIGAEGDASAGGAGDGSGKGGEEFKPVAEVFKDAPAPFAPGYSPRTTDQDAEAQKCAQCQRKRWDGWSAHGQWYCANCWRKWQRDGGGGGGEAG